MYRLTDKRLAANRANLAKANRQEEVEQVVDSLDLAFPPLGDEVGENSKIETGNSKIDSRPIPGESSSGKRKSNTAGPEDDDPDVPENDGVRRKFWVIGWPQGREGVNREAADYGALEKAGRAILHRQRALLFEARREGRQVMRLLTQAAERTAAPALQDILSLAYGLITALVDSRFLGRAQRLNQRVEERVEAFVEKRYGTVVSWKTQMERLQAYIQGQTDPACGEGARRARLGAAGMPLRPKRRPRARPKPEAQQATAEPVSGAGVGPNLPATLEEFQGLVRRAFCAPRPEPEDDALRSMLDDLAESVWERLHVFDVELRHDTQRLDQALDEMGDTLPENDRDLLRRCCCIAAMLKQVKHVEPLLRMHNQDLRQSLGTLMSQRYGLVPEIDRFLRSSG